MNNLERYEDRVWDFFFDDLSADVLTMSREEVQTELKRRRIDVSRAVSRVQLAVAARTARAELAAARLKRASVVEQIAKVVAPEIKQLRQTIGDMIANRLHRSAQAAYFRKLQQAAGDDDLRALMDDIERLDALSREDNECTETE
jgi:hypothetical protein